MKLRTARKIANWFYGPYRWKKLRIRGWKHSTRRKAIKLCEKHWLDRRIPYIPSEEEEIEGFGFMMGMLADCFIDDEKEREQVKNEMWEKIANCGH